MNIMSALVGVTVMGASAPMMMQMSIAPFEAQKRAENLGVAESLAVTFAAINEGSTSFTDIPDNCDLDSPSSGAFTITCTMGEGTRYAQTVSRSFRSQVDGASLGYTGEDNARVYANATPGKFGAHQCPSPDPWGINYFNDQFEDAIGACVPQDIWTKAKYLASDPNAWLFDVNNHNGWGDHPNYQKP